MSQTSNFSFPYHYATYKHGIRPNHVTEDQMNETLYKLYEDWRKLYLWTEGCPEPDMLRAWSGAGGYKNGTCSEAMGYSMLISVYMATDDNHAHEDFDALYKYYKYYTKQENGARTEGLMGWLIDANGKAVSGVAATDGDLDVGFALVLAAKKWKTGAFDYLAEAKNQINIMMEGFVNQENFSILSSDIKTGTFTMSAYLMPAWFKVFAEVTGDDRWLKVIDFSYKAYKKYIDLNPETGLMPYTFNVFTMEIRDPKRDVYGWDACRVPWRFGTDYLWNGTVNSPIAYEGPFTNVKWFNKSTGGDPANHVHSYELDGTRRDGIQTPTIVGPMAIAAMVDASQQDFLNAMYDYLVALPLGRSKDSYFMDMIEMLTLIVITGNHPNMYEM